jgi:hypothetical protein
MTCDWRYHTPVVWCMNQSQQFILWQPGISEEKSLGESVHPQQLCTLTHDFFGIREMQKAKFCWEISYRKCLRKRSSYLVHKSLNGLIQSVWAQRVCKMILGVDSGQPFTTWTVAKFYFTVVKDHQTYWEKIRLFTKIGEEKDLRALYAIQYCSTVTTCEAFIMTLWSATHLTPWSHTWQYISIS